MVMRVHKAGHKGSAFQIDQLGLWAFQGQCLLVGPYEQYVLTKDGHGFS